MPDSSLKRLRSKIGLEGSWDKGSRCYLRVTVFDDATPVALSLRGDKDDRERVWHNASEDQSPVTEWQAQRYLKLLAAAERAS